jgi:uncharacterized protein YfaA (DUF2138 family)
MNAQALEHFLARLYTDDALRQAFVDQPERVAREAGLDETTRQCLLSIDRDGLALAAHSYACKRSAHAQQRAPRRGWADWRRWFQR